MTGYYIRIGYNPTRGDSDEMWRLLKEEARNLADKPEAIIEEVLRVEDPSGTFGYLGELDMYADIYREPFDSDGHPVAIVEERGEQYVQQLASTDRGLKYHVRRAYARLLIEAMHRHGIEVCLSVA
jgi:hypothetical protein